MIKTQAEDLNKKNSVEVAPEVFLDTWINGITPGIAPVTHLTRRHRSNKTIIKKLAMKILNWKCERVK